MIWPKKFSKIALAFTFIIILIHYTLYPQYVMPVTLLFFGFLVIFFFYSALHYFTKQAQSLDDRSFTRSLFFKSLLIKILFLASTLILILLVDPKSYPFEIGGGSDSYYYHRAGSDVADGLFKADLNKILKYWYNDKADYGYPTYVGVIYFIFGKYTVLLRLISILFSSFTIVMVYKLARNIYGEQIGRFAGILAMLMPSMLWFDTMSVKESIMTFIIVLCLYLNSEILRFKRVKVVKIFILIAAILTLFFFRQFLPWLIIFVTLLFLLLNLKNRRISQGTVFVAFMIFVFVIFLILGPSKSFNEVKTLVIQSQTQLEEELVFSANQRGINYQKSLVIPFLLGGSIITPFPSLLYFDSGQLTMVSHFFNELVRNSLYFFGLVGLWISYKKHFKKSSLIILFFFGYILVLAMAGKSYQDRMQFPALPCMLILISVGFAQGQKYFKKWIPYLALIGSAIIIWNLFKLSVRGLL